MNILDSELVRKYFETDKECGGPFTLQRLAWECDVSLSILRAMQQTIKQGDKFLNISKDGKMTEETYSSREGDLTEFHGYVLRLPAKWQKKVRGEK